MKHANKGIHPCFETQKSSDFTTARYQWPCEKGFMSSKISQKRKEKNWFLLTYSILCSVIFFGKIITVTKNDLTTPHVYDCSNSQIAIFVVIYMNSSCLKTMVVC